MAIKPPSRARSGKSGASARVSQSTSAVCSPRSRSSAATSGGGAAASAEDGSYAIVPSNAVGTGLSNYAITYVPGTMTVLETAIVVTATPLTSIN